MDHTSGPMDMSQGAPIESSILSQSVATGQSGRFNEDFDNSPPQSMTADGEGASGGGGTVVRSDSIASQAQTLTPSRGGTLKKKNSLKRGGGLKRSSSRRSLGAGSVKSLALGDREKYEGSDLYSAFYTPVPTKGNPTEILANRFQDWRRVLKDLVAYFREVQKSYDARSKSLLALTNLVSNISGPPSFAPDGGIGEATKILRNFHKQALAESNKAKNIEEEIMAQLAGLRGDLSQKIKEIKSLSGDFKNSVEKETESTRKAVRSLQDALNLVETDPGATSGKGDPYIVKLGVDRQIDRQIDEENYLHKAFLNLENSGRELESIVVGEIQKAYNAYAGILKREADEAYETVETLRTGPVAMSRDHEWDSFVSNNENFVDPKIPLRHPQQIHYPGSDAPAAAEVRSGMLERKSKYLKSYTPGWYVLSPTHLHEFKSADRIGSQPPIMSLYLNEQKLGSHSNEGSSSHKFMLKGRQTGGMHRGHGWVFRAESRDTMLAWYDDIKNLTEKKGLERDAFVRKHARSTSAGSAPSISSDGAMEEDEADRVPYSATASQVEAASPEVPAPQRPQPGGRFPSDLNVDRHLHMPMSPSSGTSSDERDALAAAGALTGSDIPSGEPGREGFQNKDRSVDPARQHIGAYDFTATRPRTALEATQTQTPDIRSAQANSRYSGDSVGVASTSYPVLNQNEQRHSQTRELHSKEAPISSYTDPAMASPPPPLVMTQQRQEDASYFLPSAPLATAASPAAAPIPTQVGSSISEEQRAMAPNTVQHQMLPPVDTTLATQPAKIKTGETPVTAIPPSATLEGRASMPTTPATTMTTLSDSTTHTTTVNAPPTRPPLLSEASGQTISDLHVPGEFPRVATA